MPGPAPKPASQRRRTNAPMANTVTLPSEGRTGRAPAWPLSKMRAGEKARWDRLWSLPQALMWERIGCAEVVARYVRVVVDAEKADASAAVRKTAADLEDRLGLTPMSMLRLRWEIVADETAERRDVKPASRRLRAVDAG